MLKSYLVINGAYEVGIDFKENGEKEYFVTRGPYFWEHWKKVNQKEFIRELEKYDWILKGWNKELKQEYAELLKQEGVKIDEVMAL